ncbi:hypothetical protein BFP72_06325 [Reichenbachiella sp. 5M10]|uniref:LysM peptidoglycan-binding domain-containing protein n=1 Tax=Reichenbachiella sp. 5M10 TaxID=1889772 RepID=UPI000C15E319|nr:LysM peptidoglycan-binding domain-containing protein [Reichenbachiella sp. 5M10]PIB35037.1 hypothetical protein BFP72_06325 [Reichenbachiella sp. 5M10]
MRYSLIVLLFLIGFSLHAEDPYRPKVPSSMEFAGMKLKITDAARNEIQKDVDMLTNSEKYFEIKADRARLYFPIIEKTLKKENVPDDFKYLSLQESALISDAVSSANAVGFWQFKDFTGREVGLRIDRSVDERLNIVASTVGASKYFKRHNFYFNNWIYTLLAHMTGRGGAAKYVDKDQFGANRMTIDRKTHWYVKRCLAHKIAFEHVMEKKHSEGMQLIEFEQGGGKTLSKIASELNVSETDLKQYNKWLKSGKVPEEKTYVVIVPVKGNMKGIVKISGGVEKPAAAKSDEPKSQFEKMFPSLSKGLNTNESIFIKINGLPTVLAKPGDGVIKLSREAGIEPERFAKYNDIQVTDGLEVGEVYYLRSKRNRGQTYYYTVQQGETLWKVSQKFGVKMHKLARLNRMMTIDPLVAGRVMWLRKRRPKDVPVEIRELPAMPVDETIPAKELQEIPEDQIEQERLEPAQEEAYVPGPEEVESPLPEELKVEEEPVEKEELPEFMEVGESAAEPMVEPVVVEPNLEKEEKGSYFRHTVKKGETLYGISKKYGVSVSDVQEWNDLQNGELRIGQELVIHGEGRPFQLEPEQVDFHVVGPGDTMYSISKQYNMPIEDLLRINQKDNFALSIGERIRVKE